MRSIHLTGPRFSGAMLLLATSAAFSTSAWAELKTDGLWRGGGGLAISRSSGNTESSSVQINADLARATLQDKYSLGGAYNYATNDTGGARTTSSNKWNLFSQYDYNLSRQLYGFGRLAFESDKLSALDLRSTLAGGLGYKLIDNAQTRFNVFGGAAHASDHYGREQTIGGKKDTRFSRSSLYLGEESMHELTANTSLKQRLEYSPGISGDKAKLTKFTAGLSVAMSSTLSLTVGFSADHNSAPPNGKKSTDTLLFTGINVKLGSL